MYLVIPMPFLLWKQNTLGSDSVTAQDNITQISSLWLHWCENFLKSQDKSLCYRLFQLINPTVLLCGMQKCRSFSAAATPPPAISPLLERSMQFPHSGESLSLLASRKTFLLWGSEDSLKQENPLFTIVSMIMYSFGTRGRQFPCGPTRTQLVPLAAHRNRRFLPSRCSTS